MVSLKRLLTGRSVFLKLVGLAALFCAYLYYTKCQNAVGIFGIYQAKAMRDSSTHNTQPHSMAKRRNVTLGKRKGENVKDVKHVKNVETSYCAVPSGGYELNVSSGAIACRIPKLNPFHPDAMKYVVEDPDGIIIRCETEKRATLSGGILNITGTDVHHSSYQYITRPENDDFDFRLSDEIKITSHNFAVPHENIKLTLVLNNEDVVTEFLMQAVPRKEIISRPSPASELNLSVFIIGLDSMSNGNAQRKLLKSYNYIRTVLEGYIFMGHSVVGDGTTEQLAAFLTGKGEQEHYESRRGEWDAKPVDGWDWIFKKVKAKGYVTSFCEDTPTLATFQYRLLGFQKPPTDYYARPFFLASAGDQSGHCIGSEKVYNYHLDLAKKIYEQYPQRRKFLLHFASEISHNKFNTVEKMDGDLLKFLAEMEKRGHLNKTLLILLGDHGLRFGEFRQTVQGKLEERLPLFTMVFPKWFRQKYPTLAKNLKTNTKRLTSWFDLHATFIHLIEYPSKPKDLKHGMSLLEEVPAKRSCKDASIPQHWCPCMQWSTVDKEHVHLKHAVLAAINHMNDMIFREPLGAEKCSELRLLKLIRGEVEAPIAQVMRFDSSGKDGYEPNYSSKKIEPKDRCSYQVTFETLPNHGVFEASVQYVYGRFLVKGRISRINKYGDQPKCVANVIPNLREYCYCKDNIKS